MEDQPTAELVLSQTNTHTQGESQCVSWHI